MKLVGLIRGLEGRLEVLRVDLSHGGLILGLAVKSRYSRYIHIHEALFFLLVHIFSNAHVRKMRPRVENVFLIRRT